GVCVCVTSLRLGGRVSAHAAVAGGAERFCKDREKDEWGEEPEDRDDKSGGVSVVCDQAKMKDISPPLSFSLSLSLSLSLTLSLSLSLSLARLSSPPSSLLSFPPPPPLSFCLTLSLSLSISLPFCLPLF